MHTSWKKSLALAAVLAAVVSIYALGVRPWLFGWGATLSEQSRTLPGDEIVPRAEQPTTRAVTIEAPIAAVWPWLAQLGQDRAGFYSFELLEDLAGCEMPRAEVILPDAQQWRPGDSLWMYPPSKLGGAGGAPLLAAIPGRALAFGTWHPATSHTEPPDGSWAFVLDPLDAATTRLLVRGRGTALTALPPLAFHRAVFEPMHFVMERRMMENLQRLAEGREPYSRAADVGQIVIWIAMLATVVWSLGAVVRRQRWLPPLAVTGAAAFLFQVVTLAQPPVWAGALLVLILAGLLRRGRRLPEVAGTSEGSSGIEPRPLRSLAKDLR